MNELKSVAITGHSQKLLHELLEKHPRLKSIAEDSKQAEDFESYLAEWAKEILSSSKVGLDYYQEKRKGKAVFDQLRWQDFAAIRILDYIDHTGEKIEDRNLRGEMILNQPFRILFHAIKDGSGGGQIDFFQDIIQLFNQLESKDRQIKPKRKTVEQWMAQHPSGLDQDIIDIRRENKQRILNLIIDKIDAGTIDDHKFRFTDATAPRKEKMAIAQEWWNNRLFHLRMAFRDPDTIQEMLDHSLSTETMDTLYEAKEAGIPFFVNPYYLSLLNVRTAGNYIASDQAIRDYILYSPQLIDEFGHIEAWEKEDIVEPGKPNAAGWLLPEGHNIHRRYPEVAIMIPDSMGRACGGLCTSCQRMYDFQSGHLNFDLDKLKPRETWPEKLKRLIQYFEDDNQLRDILITGGDALMSSDKSLKRILDAVYEMAINKREKNKALPKNKKKAEMVRVRLGTRLPVYLPQRITDELEELLRDFKTKAASIGIKQFVIQTHFESAMEITPEAAEGIKKLRKAGWTVTNQLVFTAAASRRGHTAKLRKALNDVGVLTYYTFTVKGYMENSHNFATNARSIQERIEEKVLGEIPEQEYATIHKFPEHAENMIEHVANLRNKYNLPFLATDRNVMNMPGVGKSNTFRTIGITHDGRRILKFDHDATRLHSPIVDKMGRVLIVESKSMNNYLQQMTEMGEDPANYRDVYGYSLGETEFRMPVYEYPKYDFDITDKMSNLQID
ncbi:MAG: KamA family protein [Bacteroidales bacterium]